jgi:Sulfatase-modifying factor enzyme 1
MISFRNRITAAAALALLASAAGAAGPPGGALTRCPLDAVVSGAGCMDKYEASVWRVPNSRGANMALVRRIQQGKATAALLAAGGATQLGIAPIDDYAPCADSGQNCADDVYAVSVPGVTPSAKLTWFQAQAACENAGKRLPSNAEWQAAVLGTPDPGDDNGTSDCNTASAFKAVATGSRTACVSARGAFDMVGNLYEWVADWVPRATACGTWSPSLSPTGDDQCIAGAAGTGEPGALLRGGSFFSGSLAGPLAVLASNPPSGSNNGIGFRCTR